MIPARSTTSSFARTGALVTALVALAAGCSAGSSGSTISPAVVSFARGAPSQATPPQDFPADASALWAGARQIYVVTYGSSSCPRIPTVVRADGAHRVTITTKDHLAKGDTACTSDYGPTTSTVNLPALSDVTTALTVAIDKTIVTLTPR